MCFLAVASAVTACVCVSGRVIRVDPGRWRTRSRQNAEEIFRFALYLISQISARLDKSLQFEVVGDVPFPQTTEPWEVAEEKVVWHRSDILI